MSVFYAVRVWESGTLTGTDPTYTLPGTANSGGYRTLSGAGCPTGSLVYLMLVNTSTNAWEYSTWTYTSGTPGTITRVTFLASSTGATINWASITATIGLELPPPVLSTVGTDSNDQGGIPSLGPKGALDGSVVPLYGRYVSGNWYSPPCLYQGQFTPGDNQLYFMPFFIFEPWTFQGIGFQPYGSSPTTATSVRVGMYFNSNGKPGALAFDGGTLSISTTGSGNSATLSGVPQLQPGLYWACYGSSSNYGMSVLGATGQIDTFVQSIVGTSYVIGNNNINSNSINGYWSPWTYGALPTDTSSLSNLYLESGGIPFIGLQA